MLGKHRRDSHWVRDEPLTAFAVLGLEAVAVQWVEGQGFGGGFLEVATEAPASSGTAQWHTRQEGKRYRLQAWIQRGWEVVRVSHPPLLRDLSGLSGTLWLGRHAVVWALF